MIRGAFSPRLCFLPLIALTVCFPAATAFAGDTQTVSVRVGTHPDFGRVVFDLPTKAGYHLTQDGDHVTIKFDNTTSVASAPRGTRNVLSITGGDGSAELVVAPGTSVREQHYGNHVVIDIVDAGVGGTTTVRPPTGTTAASPAVPPAPKPPAPKPPTQATLPPATPEPPAPAPPKPVELTSPPPPQAETAVTPETVTASVASPDDVMPASTMVVPFSGSPLGAAAFRRGRTGLVVFDRPITLDLSVLHDDPVFSTATAQALPGRDRRTGQARALAVALGEIERWCLAYQ